MNLSVFSVSYAQARQKFLDSCARRGLTVESHPLHIKGRDQETLAIDICRMGSLGARNLMVVSSGCHGIEGFCGSAVQVDLLNDDSWISLTNQPDLAVLYIHALNPYGFSWLRRVTQENVDLNRNFLDFNQPLPDNSGYRALANVLVPARWPVGLANTLQMMWFVARHGRKGLQSAITRGQHSHPDGLFFCGNEPTWSNQKVRTILRQHAQKCQSIGWIDVHTGLGPQGVGERIYKGRETYEDLARARAWWGEEVTNSFDGSATSARLSGTLDMAVMQECPQAQFSGLTLEFGTLPGRSVLQALRADQWLHLNPNVSSKRQQQIKQQICEAFYVQTPWWMDQVLTQSRQVCRQTVEGLLQAR